jgi:ribosomal protein S13
MSAEEPNDADEGEEEDIQYFVRIGQTDLDGTKSVERSLTDMNGIGRRAARLIAEEADVERTETFGALDQDQIDEVVDLVEGAGRHRVRDEDGDVQMGGREDALIDEGRLTSGRLDISSKQAYHDAGDQLEDAKDLREEVKEYIDDAKENGLDRAESELFETKQREEELERKVGKLEDAEEEEEKRTRYNGLVNDKDTIEENLGELEELPEDSKLDDIDGRLEDLSEDEGKQSELEDQKESSLSLAKWSVGAGLGAFGLLLAFGFPAVGVLASVVFLVFSGYLWYQAKDVSEEISELSVKEERILSDARAAGISFGGREEVRGEISRIKDERQELEDENQRKKAVLEREFDFEAESMYEVVDKAEEHLEALENDIDDSLDVEYDEDEYQQAEKEFEDAKSRREQLEEDLREHREQLQEFRERANKLDFSIFVGERLDLEVDNLDALSALVNRLDEFISAIENDAEASKVAIEIFDEIQEEEKEETAELFEEGSRATEIFEEITDGRYTKVTYDNEENQLEVVKSTGESFTPDKLSDGTRDQLYLSIRVALGEKVLEGNSGFFVMDDAFLTSDSSRLETQVDVVEKLSDEGWQIIYLSSKEDATSALSERTDNDVLELQPLE